MATAIEEILLRVTTDLGKSLEELGALATAVEGVNKTQGKTRVDASTREAKRAVAEFEAELAAATKQDHAFEIKAKTKDALGALAELEVALIAATEDRDVKVQGQAHFEEVFAALVALQSEEIDIPADVSLEKARAALDAFVAHANTEDIDLSLHVEGLTKALAEIEAVKHAGGGNVDLHATADAGAAVAAKEISNAFDQASASSNEAGKAFSSMGISVGNMSFRLGEAGIAVAGLAALIIGSLVAAIGALVASAGAAVTALGLMTVALGGALLPVLVTGLGIFTRFTQVMNAKKAQDQEAAQATRAHATAERQASQAAEQRRSAALAVRDAMEGVTSAERRLSDATKRARQDIVDATKAEAKAHRSAIEAHRDYITSTKATAKARTEAAQAIKDAAAKVADAEKGARDARRDGSDQVAQAIRNASDADKEVTQQALAGNKAIAQSYKDVRDAKLAVGYAKLDLEDAKDHVKDLEKQLEKLKNAAPDSLKKLNDIDLQNFDTSTMPKDQQANAEKLQQLARDLARARLDVESANNKVTDSEDNLNEAQSTNATYIKDGLNAYEPYTNAVVAAGDAHKDLHDTIISVNENISKAVGDVATARAEYKKLRDEGVAGNPAVLSAIESEHDARVRLSDAKSAEAEAERKLRDLRNAGISGAPAVISAQNSLRDAHEGLTQALHRQKIAGQDNALPTAGTVKAEQAVHKLTDQEKELLSAIRDVSGAFKDAITPATDAFFHGLADAILLIKPALKEIGPSLAGVGKALGDVVVAIARDLASPEGVKFFKDMSKAAADLIRIIGTDAFISFFHILENIAEAAMPSLIKGAKAFAGVLRGWADDTKNAKGIQDFLEVGVDALGAWFKLGGAVARLLLSFFSAGGKSGSDLVRWLATGADKLADFFNSAKGSAQLKGFFKDVMPLVKALASLIGHLFVIFMQLFQFAAPIFAPTIQALDDILGAISKLLGVVNQITSPIRAFLGELLKIVALRTVFGTFGTAIVEGLTHGFSGLYDAFVKPFVDAFNAVLDFFGISSPSTKFMEVGKDIAKGLIGGIKDLASDFVDVGGWVIDKVIGGVKAVGGTVKDGAGWVKDQFVAFVKLEVSGFKNIGSWIIDHVTDGIKTIGGVFGDVGGWIKNRIVDFLHAEMEGFKNIGSWIINRVADGIRTITDLLGGIGGWLFHAAEKVIHDAVDGFTGIGSWVITKVAAGITTVVDELKNIGTWIYQTAQRIIHDSVKEIEGIGHWIAGAIVDGIKGAFRAGKSIANSFIDFLNDLLPNKIKIPHGPDINLPDNPIPHLASGAILTQPTYFLGGEAGDEAVLPLTTQMYRSLASGIISQLRVQMPAFAIPSLTSVSPSAPSALGGSSGVNVEKVILPESIPDQNGFDGRHGAAVFLQELRSRGAA